MQSYDYRGAIHVHSDLSDGRGSVDEIMAAANDAGLDFVILTDHDHLKARDREGWHGSTLLIVGTEITPPENHYLAVGAGPLEGVETLKTLPTQELVDKVGEGGWLGFIAHPFYRASRKFGTGSYPWTAWNTQRFHGIGIWHLISDWLEQCDREDTDPVRAYEMFPRNLRGPNADLMARWDSMGRHRRVVGIGEIDNHKITHRYQDKEFVVFPYERAFRTISNHVILSQAISRDAVQAKAQILDALKRGRLYVSLDWDWDPTEFSFTMDRGNDTFFMGEEVPLGKNSELNVSLPEEATLRLIRNGEAIREVLSFELVAPVESAGVYRVEVLRDGRPWIYSNPIYVRD